MLNNNRFKSHRLNFVAKPTTNSDIIKSADDQIR
jgi:hypothetical protein